MTSFSIVFWYHLLVCPDLEVIYAHSGKIRKFGGKHYRKHICHMIIHTNIFSIYILVGEGHGNPFQYFWLGNLMDREGWWTTVHRVSKSWTWLKQLGMPACYILVYVLSKFFFTLLFIHYISSLFRKMFDCIPGWLP